MAPYRASDARPAETVSAPEISAAVARIGPTSFAELVELARERNEGLLYGHLTTSVHLVRFEAGHIELRLGEHAPADLPQRLSRFLLEATGVRWLVTVSRETGEPTLREQRDARKAAQHAELALHPLVRAILDTFPGAIIERINQVEAPHAPESPDEPED